MEDLKRLHTGDVEIGATEVLQRHYSRHVVQPRPVSQRRLEFEHKRPRWLRECMAEATGVFFYVFPGVAAVANLLVNAENPLGAPVFSSFLQIAIAFSLGITYAIVVCAPTSGGHFNPAITLCFAIWQGFPWKKVPYYIFSQIFGAFLAGLFVMGMYWPQIQELNAATIKAGLPLVSATGPASILCVFPRPDQPNMGYVFFLEFFVDSFIGIVIWACLDPANPFVAPTNAPMLIGFAYGAMIMGFADITISTNLARDLGTRMVAAIFYGPEAFSYKNYSAISILVNIPATIFATGYYEFLLRDSLQKIGKGQAIHEEGEDGLHRHISKHTPMEQGSSNITARKAAPYTGLA